MFSLIHYLTYDIFIHCGPIIDNLNIFLCDQIILVIESYYLFQISIKEYISIFVDQIVCERCNENQLSALN